MRSLECVNKQMQVLILDEEDKEEVNDDDTEDQEADLKNLQLSIYSIVGLTSKKSIKMWGILAGRKVAVLLDCGASHNFISSVIVEEEELQVSKTPPYIVEVGDGRKIKCEGVCNQLSINIQGLEIQQDFYIFELVEWIWCLGWNG